MFFNRTAREDFTKKVTLEQSKDQKEGNEQPRQLFEGRM